MNILHLTTLIIHLMIASLTISANGSAFMAYSEPDFAGFPIICQNDDVCDLLETISIKMLVGTCGQILDSKTGKYFIIKEDIANTDYYYDGQLSACPIHSKNVSCPNGTFVKRIEWDTKFNLTEGVKLSCNKPESISNKEATIISSHQTSTFSESKTAKCASFNELTITKNITMDAIVALNIGSHCVAVNKTVGADETLTCENFTALTGIHFSIETETNYIKMSSLVCTEVPNIASVCKAEDDEQLLSLPSTNYNGKSVTQIKKKVGVGLKSPLSESEKNEFHFYNPFGLNIEYEMSGNFKKKIGKSRKTGYDWGSAPKSTWQNEQEVNIEIEASPLCNTKFFEIVGKCSYMTVRPYHLKRVDDCSRGLFTTIEQIPHNIQKRSYKSEIPESVKNTFK